MIKWEYGWKGDGYDPTIQLSILHWLEGTSYLIGVHMAVNAETLPDKHFYDDRLHYIEYGIEHALKALLTHQRIVFPETHDIETLFGRDHHGTITRLTAAHVVSPG